MTPVEALAAAMHRAWPIRTVGRGGSGPTAPELAAATVLAALDGWTLVPDADIARLQAVQDVVAEARAYLDDLGMYYTDDGEWVVPPAGHEKFEWAMDLLAGLVKEP